MIIEMEYKTKYGVTAREWHIDNISIAKSTVSCRLGLRISEEVADLEEVYFSFAITDSELEQPIKTTIASKIIGNTITNSEGIDIDFSEATIKS